MSDTSAIPPGNGFIPAAWSLIAGTAAAVWFAVSRFATKKDLREVKLELAGKCSHDEMAAKFDGLEKRHEDVRQELHRVDAKMDDKFERVFTVLSEIRDNQK